MVEAGMKFSRPKPIWGWLLLSAFWAADAWLFFQLLLSAGVRPAVYGAAFGLCVLGFFLAPFLLLPRSWANLMSGFAMLALSGFYLLMAKVTSGPPLFLLFAPPLMAALLLGTAFMRLSVRGKVIATIGLALCGWTLIEGILATLDSRGPQL
ncbi:hypothetical protein FRZ61_35150 [Hypericibacter adhaerens]|uniref:Uncharacterized protein n=1 Tax=Hypericibacter adhaerens TaxID=2602016 RepID=A0A5J6N242_9PROT|nr:hypothetical protein [Hypericibacter adhaerens]QEX23577.1 hypothetical protein FRZ61_35150 [Hypericibacter adhaerens]